MAFALALALCVMTALAIDGSVTIFVHRLQAAADQGRLLGAGNTLLKSFRLDTFRLDLAARQFSVWAVIFICGASLVLPIALGAQLIAVTQVYSGIEGPYYQPQRLRADDYSVDLGSNGGKIGLPRAYGRYVTAAQQVARRGNFVAGTR